jgi:para-nitrobenzyl esterase
LYANLETYNIAANDGSVGAAVAGAFLSISLGVTKAEEYTNELSITEDSTLSSTNWKQSLKVHTIIHFCRGKAYVKILELVYKLERFDSNDAPILIAQGTDDAIIDFSSAKILEKIKNRHIL